MATPILRSGQYVCSNHMVVKSPNVQPARQRSVLTEARFHIGLELQNAADVAESPEHKPRSAGLVVGLVTTSKSPVLYLFFCLFLPFFLIYGSWVALDFIVDCISFCLLWPLPDFVGGLHVDLGLTKPLGVRGRTEIQRLTVPYRRGAFGEVCCNQEMEFPRVCLLTPVGIKPGAV